MAFLLKKNNAKSTLNVALTIDALSLQVVSSSTFPASGNFLVTIWDKTTYPDPSDDSSMEIVLVTAVSGNIFTITRGQCDTVAKAHSKSSAVELLIVKEHFDEIEAAISSGGEVNTASNLGSGIGVYKQKVGVDLQLKSLKANSSKIVITDDVPNNEINIDVSVSKSDVGLGNVDNVSEATIITDVKADSDVADAISKKHAHVNQTALDNVSGVNTGDQDLSGKVDKVVGKDLSTNDFTDTLKNKLDGIADGAEVNVNADWNSISGDSEILNKPSIPDELSDLAEDSTHRLVTDTEKSTWNGKQDALGFTPVPDTRQVNGHALSSDVTVTKGDVGLSNVTNDAQEILTNKVTSFQVTPDDTHYPSEKLVKDNLDLKASACIRGTFVNGDLSSGILTITHNLGLSSPFVLSVIIVDNNYKKINPSDITFATNTIVIDLISFGTLSGTWGYSII